MTVSRVLRNASGFSEATRDKVMAEVNRHGYLPNRLAASFGTNQTSTLVGVCVPRLSNFLVMQALESLDRTFGRFGFQIIIGSHNNQVADEEAWLRGILSWRPAGVLLSNKHHSKGTLKLLRDTTVPILEFWNLNTSPVSMSVGFNEYDAGMEMSQHAVSKGYQKAALLLASNDELSIMPDRIDGFTEGFIQSGGQIVHTEILNDQAGFYAGYYGTENLLNSIHSIDMIYYMDDTMAIGGLAWCERKGIRVPEDIGIVGWGGHEAASVLPKRLTTSAIPVLQIGKKSAEQMARKLNNEEMEEVIAVPVKLIDGDTL